ncbi:DUF3265 domain-containing protein [Vibrio parahaemolyticus]
MKTPHLTKHLRAIRNAWRFWFWLGLVFKVQCCSYSTVALFTP